MPSFIASKTSVSKDGSSLPGDAAVVMVTAPDQEEAKQQAASMLGVPATQITVTPLDNVGY